MPSEAADRLLAAAGVPLAALLTKAGAWALARQGGLWPAGGTVALVGAQGRLALTGAPAPGLSALASALDGEYNVGDGGADLLIYDIGSLGAERGSGPLLPPALAALSVGHSGAGLELRLLADLQALPAEAAARLVADLCAALRNPYLLLG